MSFQRLCFQNYVTVHMFHPYVLDQMAFDKEPTLTAWENRELRKPDDFGGTNDWTKKRRVMIGDKKVDVGMDIFGCRKIVFLFNEGNAHNSAFSVEPATLRQKYYCSCHRRIAGSDFRRHASQKIHAWVKDQHRYRLGEDHPMESLEWSQNLVTDDPVVLGTPNQGHTVDCVVYAFVTQVFEAEGMSLDVFGSTYRDKELAGIELRRRAMLSLHHDENYFIPTAAHGGDEEDEDDKDDKDDKDDEDDHKDDEDDHKDDNDDNGKM